MILENLPVFIIHYTKLKDRKSYLEAFLNKHFLDYRFITEYDKEKLNDEDIIEKYIKDKKEFLKKIKKLWGNKEAEFRELSKSEISCSFKHLHALKKASESQSEYSLIIEDDVIPDTQFEKKFSKTLKNINNLDWDLVFVGDGIGKKFIYNKLKFRILSSTPQKVSHPSTNCADSYLIKKDAAEKLIMNFKSFNLSYDWELAYQIYLLDLKVYWSTRPVFKQGSKIGKYQSELR